MAGSTFAPDYHTRDLMTARLLALRPTLEAKGIRHAFLFGSVARGDDVPESDVDIILDLDPDSHVGIFQLSDIALFLQEALGRRVDIVTRRGLLSGRHAQILADLNEVF